MSVTEGPERTPSATVNLARKPVSPSGFSAARCRRRNSPKRRIRRPPRWQGFPEWPRPERQQCQPAIRAIGRPGTLGEATRDVRSDRSATTTVGSNPPEPEQSLAIGCRRSTAAKAKNHATCVAPIHPPKATSAHAGGGAVSRLPHPVIPGDDEQHALTGRERE